MEPKSAGHNDFQREGKSGRQNNNSLSSPPFGFEIWKSSLSAMGETDPVPGSERGGAVKELSSFHFVLEVFKEESRSLTEKVVMCA